VKSDCAFQFNDLAVLLGLDRTEPADHADIDAISRMLGRRRAAHTPQTPEQGEQYRATLHLVPDCPP
jgi:hypothetical protein